MSRRFPARAGWVALLATCGCEQILGLHERSETLDAGSTAIGASFDAGPSEAGLAELMDAAAGKLSSACGSLAAAPGSCAACMNKTCCAEAQACAADPACVEASNCLAACSEATCRARCAEFYSSPKTLVALRACRVSSCASACDGTCGEFASANPTCQKCQETTCCSQQAACAGDTSCAGLNLCVSNCFGAASCPSDCESQYAQGVTGYTAALTCGNQCANQCAPGQTWSCLDGPVVWPKPNAVGEVALSVTFVSFTTEEPFAFANVKACGKLDLLCSSPMDTGTTDATGMVTVHVPVGLAGFDGYLYVTGGAVGGDGGTPVFPTIWYPIPYVIADGWRGRTLLVSSDEFVGLTMASGTTLDPTHGHIAMNAADCAFTPATDVQFNVAASDRDQETVSFYLVGGVPVTTATQTDSSGIGAVVNLPTTPSARLIVVGATAGQANGKSMGSLSFILRPGTLTTSGLFPPLP